MTYESTAILKNSERRIRNNRIRRQRQLRKNIFIFVLSLICVCSFAFLFASVKTEASASADQILYKHYTCIKVGYGDTLYNIADDYVCDGYNTTESFIEEVCFINSIENSNKIVSGSNIIVPYYSTVSGQ